MSNALARRLVVTRPAPGVGFTQRFLVSPFLLPTMRLERAIRSELTTFDAVREWDGGT